MKRLVLAAGLLVSMTATAHDMQIDLSNNVKEYVTSGIDSVVGMKLANDVVENVLNGGSCVNASRDGQRSIQRFMVRDQESITCVIQMGEETAFIVVNYATKGVTRTLVLAGDVLHEMGQEIGKPLRERGIEDLEDSADWTLRFTGLLTWPLGLIPASVGLAEFTSGAVIEGAGEAGYVVTTEVAKRITVTVENAKGLTRSATAVATEASMGQLGNSFQQVGASLGNMAQLLRGLLVGENEAALDAKIKSAGYSVKIKQF